MFEVTRVTYLAKWWSFWEIALTKSSVVVPVGRWGTVTVYFEEVTMLLFFLKSSSLKTNYVLFTLAIVSKTALASSILPCLISSLGDSVRKKGAIECNYLQEEAKPDGVDPILRKPGVVDCDG